MSNGVNTKTRIILALIVAVFVGAVFFFRGGSTKPGSTHDSAGLIVGTNAIYVAEQSPSRTVSVAVARLEKTGFVVIHEDAAGPRSAGSAFVATSAKEAGFSEASAPGRILGTSGLLPAGETKNLAPIALSRATADGETLYAMLHLDDGDGVFDPAKDEPAQDSVGSSGRSGSEEPSGSMNPKSGEPVMMIFTVSVDASEPGAVNL